MEAEIHRMTLRLNQLHRKKEELISEVRLLSYRFALFSSASSLSSSLLFSLKASRKYGFDSDLRAPARHL